MTPLDTRQDGPHPVTRHDAHVHAYYVHKAQGALVLCGSADEAERLAIRGYDAMDGSAERENTFYAQYRGRDVIVTPAGRSGAYGAAVLLHIYKARVEAPTTPPGLDDDADIFTLVREPMFRERDLAPEAPLEQSVSWPAPLDLPALAEQPVPERVYRVGTIMAVGTVGLITGHGGAGKTQLGLHLGACVALGRAFFGEPVLRCKVAFVSAEDDAHDLHYRLVQQAAQLKISLAELSDFFVYDVSDCDSTLIVDDGDLVSATARYWKLQEELERRAVALLILDNLMSLCPGNVNDPRYATGTLSLLGKLVPTGGNVALIAHVDKALARVGYGSQAYSGTAAWRNRSRWGWFLYSPNRGDDKDNDVVPIVAEDDGCRVLEVQKNNAGAVGQRINLRFNGPSLRADALSGDIVASIESGQERKAVLAVLHEAADRRINVPAAETNRSTAYEALEAMPSYPASLRGKAGKRRLFRLLRQLRADRNIEICEFRGAGRHPREGYRLARIEK